MSEPQITEVLRDPSCPPPPPKAPSEPEQTPEELEPPPPPAESHKAKSRALEPSEYSVSVEGIYKKWDFSAVEGPRDDPDGPKKWWYPSMLEILSSYATRQTKVWKTRWRATMNLRRQSLLLLRFIAETTSKSRTLYIVLAMLDLTSELLPAWRDYQSSILLDLASTALPGSKAPWGKILSSLVKIGAAELLSIAIDRFQKTNSKLLQTQHKLEIENEILRVHLRLDDNTLSRRTTSILLDKVRTLSAPIHSIGYSENREGPLAPFFLLSGGLGLAAEAAVVFRQLNRRNAPFIALDLLLYALPFSRDVPYGGRFDGYLGKFTEISSNSHMRLRNIFKLGTSTALRREVTSNAIQEHLLASFEAERDNLKDTVIEMDPAYGYSGQSAWLDVFRLSAEPITNSAYTIMASAHNSPSAFLSLAQLNKLCGQISSLQWRRNGLLRQGEDLFTKLSAVEAWYACKKLCARAPSTPYAPLPVTPEGPNGMRIEFRDVSMRYPGSERKALDHVSFTIEPGQLVALVGKNGSGKTTLISLLTENITEGDIFINGVNLSEFAPEDLLPHMSFTHQTTPSLPVTIKEYLSLGVNDPDSTDGPERLKKALEFANATEIVANLDEGWNSYPGGIAGALLQSGYSHHDYDSGPGWQLPRVIETNEEQPSVHQNLEVARSDSEEEEEEEKDFAPRRPNPEQLMLAESKLREWEEKRAKMSLMEKLDVRSTTARTTFKPTRDLRGQVVSIQHARHSPSSYPLSGGQWQRIALSKSVMRDVDLRCYDEPAAALDPSAEAELFSNIVTLRGRSSVLFTTHRFSLTAKADKILVFDAGKLLEEGTHADLMAIDGGEYRKMWGIQAAGFEVPAIGDEAAERGASLG